MINNIKLSRIITSIFLLFAGMLVTNTIVAPTLPAEIVQKSIKYAKAADPKQIACLAKNIFYEARNESVIGQAAVARVVVNRMKHGFGKNPCAVVYQTHVVQRETDGQNVNVRLCQFSWVCEGKSDPNKNSRQYRQAEQVAYDVLVHDKYTNVVPKSTLFFHNTNVDPSWPYRKVATIGNHIFYSREKRK